MTTVDQVAATAVSALGTIEVEVSAAGFVTGVRLHRDEARRWSSWLFGDRVVDVARVAHDRFRCAQVGTPSPGEVAAREQKLRF